MNALIEGGQQYVSHVEHASVGFTRRQQRLEHIIWYRTSVSVVCGHAAQRHLFPAPVLQHLRWRFHKVSLHRRSTANADQSIGR